MPLLKAKIHDDMKMAMRAHEKERLGVIRLILAAIKQYEVDERKEVDDNQVLIILDKMLKQRRESILQYEQANRLDLLAQEQFEVKLIQNYLPEPYTEEALVELIQQAITQSQAKNLQDMGKIMAILKPILLGRADMQSVSVKIKDLLSIIGSV